MPPLNQIVNGFSSTLLVGDDGDDYVSEILTYNRNSGYIQIYNDNVCVCAYEKGQQSS